MKKTIVLILMCFCFIFAGCNYGGAVLVQNSDGSVIEYFYVPYLEQELVTAGVDINTSRGEILPAIKQECDKMFKNLLNEYQSRVGANLNYTLEERTALVAGVTIKSNLPSNLFLVGEYFTEIKYEMSFANSTCYNEFKNINDSVKEDRVIEKINNLFTTTTKIIKDPIFDKTAQDSITIGQKCVNLANTIMERELGTALWEKVKEDIGFETYSSKFDYTYVVPTARIHTNADSVKKSTEGYYYHTWQVDLNNISDGESLIKIEYWTITANRPVWYLTALLGAGVVIALIYFIGKNKEKQEAEKFKIEI